MSCFAHGAAIGKWSAGLTVCLVVLGCLSVVGPVRAGSGDPTSAAPPDSNEVSILLGYSFGLANNPFGDAAQGVDNNVSANEPLLGLYARLAPDRPVHLDLTLAMANFGRLVGVVKGQEATPENGAPDVRRSILADLTVGTTLATFRSASSRLSLSGNLGFVFDAQSDQRQSVADASGYLMVGPTLQSQIGRRSRLALDLFVGPSEVMTNREIFSSEWKFRDTRLRPRILFALDASDKVGATKGNGFFDGPFSFGLWADLGLNDRFGDTYALFISRTIASFR